MCRVGSVTRFKGGDAIILEPMLHLVRLGWFIASGVDTFQPVAADSLDTPLGT